MARLFRVATVGAGYFSRFHYDAWSRINDVELVAICNRDQERARAVAIDFAGAEVFDELETMLDRVRPDLVDIITPPPTHLPFIKAAVARKIPVICQKPFCQSFEEAEAAVEIASSAGVTVAVHENFRFQPWHGEGRRLLDKGALGDPYGVTFRLRPGDGQGPEAYLDRQPYFQTMERFLVHETAIHLIDTFRYLAGEASTVYADLRRLNPAIAGEDAGVILLQHDGGTRSLFDGNRLADHAARNRRLTMGEMLLEGSDATLRLDGDGRLFLRPHGSNDESEHRYEWQDRGFGGDCVYRMQRHVIDHLATGAPLMNSAADYLTNLRIEEAAYTSSGEGRRIDLR